MQRTILQSGLQRSIKQRVLIATQHRSIHNASNPHQSSTTHQQYHVQPTPHHEDHTINDTQIDTLLSSSVDLIRCTHNHIRTQRWSSSDRIHAQLSQYDSIQSSISRFPLFPQYQQSTSTVMTPTISQFSQPSSYTLQSTLSQPSAQLSTPISSTTQQFTTKIKNVAKKSKFTPQSTPIYTTVSLKKQHKELGAQIQQH